MWAPRKRRPQFSTVKTPRMCLHSGYSNVSNSVVPCPTLPGETGARHKSFFFWAVGGGKSWAPLPPRFSNPTRLICRVPGGHIGPQKPCGVGLENCGRRGSGAHNFPPSKVPLRTCLPLWSLKGIEQCCAPSHSLQQKVFRKINFEVSREEVTEIVTCVPGAIERLLRALHHHRDKAPPDWRPRFPPRQERNHERLVSHTPGVCGPV